MSIKPLTVALVGNPNTGKSTLFNALSGLHQRVGNYPGVTVELKKGRHSASGVELDLIDLPGTYSLAARSPDEMVAVDLLLGRRPEEPRPDVIVSVVDASNLDRHLYLTSQLLDLGVPVVLAVNMIDTAAAQGIAIDYTTLGRELGIPVVPIRADRREGLDGLVRAVVAAGRSGTPPVGPSFPEAFQKEVVGLQTVVGVDVPPVLTRRLLLDVGGYTEQWLLGRQGRGLAQALAAARDRLSETGCGVPGVEARTRYGWIKPIIAASVAAPATRAVTWTDRIDRVLTHRVWGTMVFLGLMFLVFQSIFYWAKPLMDAIDSGRAYVAGAISANMSPGPLRGLVADGVVKGVGSVLIFLPQIMILFGFIAVLEDCGYMARAAFLMDRIMSRCGLSGKSFIPLLSSVACAVPGIMAARVIEHPRDRLATILVAPLMSCSARLPVYILMIGAFLKEGFPTWLPGLVLFGMYMIGFVCAPIVALLLKRTVLKAGTPVFVMELPSYKRPTIPAVLRRMTGAGWAFVVRAGTVILAAMILIWALLYFPYTDPTGTSYEERLDAAEKQVQTAEDEIKDYKAKAAEDALVPENLEAKLAEAEAARNTTNGEWRRYSYLGRTGLALEPAFRPLGWDWKIGMAAIASFPAREVLVGTFGLIYDVGDVDSKAIGDETDSKATGLRDALRREWSRDPVRGPYGVAVAVSVMVFIALCLQCVSTLAVIRRETRTWSWPLFTFVYMTALAYVGAMASFQIGRMITDAVG